MSSGSSSIIFRCDSTLRPVIELLRNDSSALCLEGSVIADALAAVEVMPLIQSVSLVNRIVETVFSASGQFESDPELHGNSEQIMLQLMAQQDPDGLMIKR